MWVADLAGGQLGRMPVPKVVRGWVRGLDGWIVAPRAGLSREPGFVLKLALNFWHCHSGWPNRAFIWSLNFYFVANR